MKLDWKGKIIDIYLIREVIQPFLTGVIIVTIIMLSSFLFQLTDLLIVKDVPLADVGRLLLFQLPELVVETFPIAILFAIMTGLGRLSQENEFTALRMGGVSLYRLFMPLIVIGLIISGMTFILNERVVPWSNHQARNIIRLNILKEVMPEVKEDVFFTGPDGRIFYVESFNEEEAELEKIMIYNVRKNRDEFPEVITAQRAEINQNNWLLKDGVIHRYNQAGQLDMESRFAKMQIEITEDTTKFFGEQKTTAEMNRAELKKEIALFAKSGIDVSSLLVDYHLKLATSLTPLIFILLGTPLSLGKNESRILNIIFTIAIIFLYYLLISLSRSLGRNGMLSPLLAAWLPHLIFAVIGLTLLVFREKWQHYLNKLVSRLLGGSLAIILLTGVILTTYSFAFATESNAVAEDKLNIKADQVEYFAGENKIELKNNIIGKYRDLHLQTERAVIIMANGSEKLLADVKEIELGRNDLSGCDYEDQHYFFRSSEVTIYPGDYLIAKHVVFWELGGKLPLFYWPVLYISLDDAEQGLVPEVGYHGQRGWFLKLDYDYRLTRSLPGKLYLDYYTISGFAGGFKQYLLHQSDQKVFLKYLTQENRTDLYGLFNWQAEFDYADQKGNWQTDTNLLYTDYDRYYQADAKLDIDYRGDKQRLTLNSAYSEQDYLSDDYRDDQELEFDFDYNLEIAQDWELDLALNHDIIDNPTAERRTRWGTESYLRWQGSRRSLKILLERYDPSFEADTEENQVQFYRWPEIQYEIQPTSEFRYRVTPGYYYESASAKEGYRFKQEIEYDKYWRLNDIYSFNMTQYGDAAYYRIVADSEQAANQLDLEDFLLNYQSEYRLRANYGNGLIWTNTYQMNLPFGRTPFRFDAEDTEEEYQSSLRYRRGSLNMRLSGGYDIYNQLYLPVNMLANWKVNPDWGVGLATGYDLNNSRFDDLIITSNFARQAVEIKSALRYDLNQMQLERVDNRIIYDLKEEWYFEFSTRYDHLAGEFDRADLILKKNFHCRQLWFTYDHLEQEYTVEYHLNIFPDQGVSFGQDDSGDFMFDLGLEELLNN